MKKSLIILTLSLLLISLISLNKVVQAAMVPVNNNPYQYYETLEFKEVSLGSTHSAAITTEGRLFTWGYNLYGDLGNGTNETGYVPTEITASFNLNPAETITKVALGTDHSLAITSEGRVFTWGWNIYGQLGNDSFFNQNVPTEITTRFLLNPGETVVDASLGYYHSLVLTSEGRIFAWGSNETGQLGNGLTDNSNVPLNITSYFGLAEGETIVKITAGDFHNFAITSTNRVFAWGYNSFGQIGDDTLVDKSTPVEITSNFALGVNETVISVSAGSYHSSALTSEGRIFTWGKNSSGQLGDTTLDYKTLPNEITSAFSLAQDETIIDLSMGGYHSIAVTSNDRIFTWGFNYYGQLGDDTTTYKSSPTDISSNDIIGDDGGIKQLSLGLEHSAFVTTQGRLFLFGNNGCGQVGDNTTTSVVVPTEIFANFLEIKPLPAYTSLTEISKVLLTYTAPEVNGMNHFLTVEIFPEFDYGSNLKSVKVNNVSYDNTSFTIENGKITLTIPNTWNVGDTVTFTVNEFVFNNDDVITATGNLIASTKLLPDLIPPIITYPNELYVEAGLGDLSLINPSAIDDTGEVLNVTITGTVDWDTEGEYLLNYFATDAAGNSATLSQTVYVLGDLTTDDETFYSFQFLHFGDEASSTSVDLTKQVLNYNSVEYQPLEDYTSYEYHLNENLLIYHFNIEEMVIIVSKVVNNPDTIPPTFDFILDQTIDEDQILDFDWTSYIHNQQDNSNQPLTLLEVEDNVLYDTPGTYLVTVKVVDESLNETAQSFTVTVLDITPPEVTLYPGLDTIEAGQTFVDAGVAITDDSSTTTVITNAVDSTIPGVYPLTYTITDQAGNVSEKIRYVTVYEKPNTVVFALGKAKTTIGLNEPYIDGACKIVYNGIQKECTVQSNNVDNTTPGIYMIVYSYSRDGKVYTYTRYVFVTDEINDLTLYYRKEGEGEAL